MGSARGRHRGAAIVLAALLQPAPASGRTPRPHRAGRGRDDARCVLPVTRGRRCDLGSPGGSCPHADRRDRQAARLDVYARLDGLAAPEHAGRPHEQRGPARRFCARGRRVTGGTPPDDRDHDASRSSQCPLTGRAGRRSRRTAQHRAQPHLRPVHVRRSRERTVYVFVNGKDGPVTNSTNCWRRRRAGSRPAW